MSEIPSAGYDDTPVRYIQRTREWYAALGHAEPYRWAHFEAVPFAPLAKPIARSSLAIVTTAAPYQPDKGPQGPGAPYNAAAKFWDVYSAGTASDPDLRISHVGIDRLHTSMEDPCCWLPLRALRALASQDVIGSVAPRLHGVPTDRSARKTTELYAPEVLARCRVDKADCALLVANCPVCHQSLSLVARHLEANGMPTVLMGCALDIVEHCGTPRFLFSDFPLGNAAGRPHDPASQALTLHLALQLLADAWAPRTTWRSPLRWGRSSAWKADYLNVAQAGSPA